MAKSRKPEIISDELAAQFGSFAGVAEKMEKDQPGVLEQLLSDAPDDTDSKELGTDELASLEEEFSDIVALTQRKNILKEELSRVTAELDAQKYRMIDAMELQGTKSFKGMGGAGEACSISERFDTKVEDERIFMDWVQEAHPELLAVNSQTRSSFIRKEFKDKGVDPGDDGFPPGISVNPRKLLVVRGVNKPK